VVVNNTLKSGGPPQGLDYVTKFVKVAMETAGDRKAVWVTLQAHNLADFRRPNSAPATL